MKHITVGVIAILLNIFTSNAQFTGGKDDGTGNGFAYGLPVEGNITCSSVYYGGQHDGYSSSSNRLHLSGVSPTGRFFGGLGDGSEQELAMFTISGTEMHTLFSGGNADGHIAKQFSFFPGGFAAGSLYSGGMDEGFSISLLTNTLRNDIPVSMYAGGEDEGTSVRNGYAGIAAPNIEMFNGSSNDGHMQKYYKGLLDMDAFYTIFQGGMDDGFFIEIQSVTLTNGTVGISKNISNDKVNIYPNPVKEHFFYVTLPETYDVGGNLQLYLTSIDGKKIPIEIEIMDDTIKVKYLTPITKGAYILTIHFADNTHLKATIMVH